MFPPSSIGGAEYLQKSIKVIRLIRQGCANRPFFHISVMEKFKDPTEPVIEQLGTYDPLPNEFNEKLVAINFERLEHWMKQEVQITVPVRELLGLAGYFPVHPDTYQKAWENRKMITERLEELRAAVAEFSKSESLNSSTTPESSTSEESSSGTDQTSSSTSSKSLPAEEGTTDPTDTSSDSPDKQ